MKPVLIVIDFINDIVHPDSKFAVSANYVKEHRVIENTNHAIKIARKNNIPIVQVKVGFSPDYKECPENSPIFSGAKKAGGLQLGTWGTEFYQSLDVQPQDFVIVKPRVSAFYGTPLEAFLRANKIDTVLISGVSSNMTVASTARDAHDRDYSVIIIEDACGAATQQLHQNAIEIISRLAKIIKAKDLEILLAKST